MQILQGMARLLLEAQHFCQQFFPSTVNSCMSRQASKAALHQSAEQEEEKRLNLGEQALSACRRFFLIAWSSHCHCFRSSLRASRAAAVREDHAVPCEPQVKARSLSLKRTFYEKNLTWQNPASIPAAPLGPAEAVSSATSSAGPRLRWERKATKLKELGRARREVSASRRGLRASFAAALIASRTAPL